MALILLGALVLGLALWDIVVTTITGRGAGPIIGPIMRWLWAGLLALHKRWRAHAVLTGGGIAIVVASVLLWVLLLWTGWSLVFLGSDGAIVTATLEKPADLWSTIYYAGFTLFTLGLGDFKPVGSLWQILTAVCAANGLLALTLSVTYLIPVVSAAVQKRQLASIISFLGGTPIEILRRNRDGNDFRGLEQPLSQLYPLIVSLAQQHLAYPSLHYLHSPDSTAALAVRLAALDDAISILDSAIRPEWRPGATTLLLTREAIALFLRVLQSAHIGPADEAPPPPSLDGIPAESLSPDGRPLTELFAPLREHRRLMRGFVENDGWSWDDVNARPPVSDRTT